MIMSEVKPTLPMMPKELNDSSTPRGRRRRYFTLDILYKLFHGYLRLNSLVVSSATYGIASERTVKALDGLIMRRANRLTAFSRQGVQISTAYWCTQNTLSTPLRWGHKNNCPNVVWILIINIELHRTLNVLLQLLEEYVCIFEDFLGCSQ